MFWKRLSLTCSLLYWTRWDNRDIGQKNSAFTILQNRLAKSLTRYSFVLQNYRNSTSWTSTSTKIFIDILLSVKRGLENFVDIFPANSKSRRKFSPTFYYQTKNFVQFFHHFFSLGVHTSVEISADILLSWWKVKRTIFNCERWFYY